MSVMSYAYEERLCRVCGSYDKEYIADAGRGHHVLFQYSIRCFAHAQCMVKKFGMKRSMELMEHAWRKREFRRALRYKIDPPKAHPLVSCWRSSLARLSRGALRGRTARAGGTHDLP